MKNFLQVAILILLLPFIGNAQQSSGDGPSSSKPVIDNISAGNVVVGGLTTEIGVMNQGTTNTNAIVHNDDFDKDRIVRSSQYGYTSGSNSYADKDRIFEIISNSLRIYPNPAVSYINVDLGTEADVEISIMNIIGREVNKVTTKSSQITIDISNLQKGTYFLSIKMGNNVLVKRVQISN